MCSYRLACTSNVSSLSELQVCFAVMWCVGRFARPLQMVGQVIGTLTSSRVVISLRSLRQLQTSKKGRASANRVLYCFWFIYVMSARGESIHHCVIVTILKVKATGNTLSTSLQNFEEIYRNSFYTSTSPCCQTVFEFRAAFLWTTN